jgi:nucleotide-binding universal stress UspA family protein
MRKPIVAGYDPRLEDQGPVRFGVAVARFTGAPLLVVAVEAGKAPFIEISAGERRDYAVGMELDIDLMDDCRQAIEDVEAELRAYGIKTDCRIVRGTSAAKALHEEAERDDAALLVVGSSRHGRGSRVQLGSTADRLIHGAPCPISVVPFQWAPKGQLGVVGVAYVDTDEGREALRAAYGLARRGGATLRVISVLKERAAMALEAEAPAEGRFGKPVEDVEGEHMLMVRRAIAREVESLGDDVPVDVDVHAGDPADVLVHVSENLDLLLMGSRGYGPVRAVLLGSVSRRVADEARCPVLVLPRGVRSSLDALLQEAPGAATPA